MGLFINTNQSALNAQRQLTSSSARLSTSFERLSSGLRINSAKDDAAGLSITSRFTAQIRGLNQAVRNSNDGISLAQTAEGALNETTNILQRLRELAVQAANDTNNSADRSSLQEEVAQLKDELDRIAETTTFNGNRLLDGSFLQQRLQIGANVGEDISLSVKGAGTADLARQVWTTAATVNTGALTGFTISYRDSSTASGYSQARVRATSAVDDRVSTSMASSSAISKAAAINSLTETTGVRAIVGPTTLELAVIPAITLNSTLYMRLNGHEVTGFHVEAGDATGALQDAINAISEETGVVASRTDTGTLTATAQDGRNVTFELLAGGVVTNSVIEFGKLSLQSRAQFDLVGADVSKISHAEGVYGVSSDRSLSSVDLSTREGAVMALDIIDLSLEDVSSSRAALGAIQNRLQSTINNLSTTSENLSAARSRILDADFAKETAELSRNQIIQQAGVSILAQANQQPQIALALIG